MSWLSIANDECVTLDNLHDAVTNAIFTPLIAFPYGDKCINKVEARTYVCLDENHPSFFAKVDDQCVAKQDLITCPVVPVIPVIYSSILTFSFVNSGGTFLQFVANLSVPIDGNVIITSVFADGFASTATCLTNFPISSSQSIATQTLAAGAPGIGFPPISSTGTWSLANSYRMYNVVVNGINCPSGASTVITIGSYTVTVVVPSCT